MGAFEDLMNKAVEDGTIMGAMLIARDRSGKLDYHRAFGHRQSSPTVEPMTEDTVFLLASFTKLMTTIACLQLVERGLISLDDDVAPWVPVLASQPVLIGGSEGAGGRPATRPRERPITLRHLLTHSSGCGYEFLHPEIARWKEYQRQQHGGSSGGGGNDEDGDGGKQTIEQAFAYPLVHEPGAGWSYGSGLDWAGQIVEKLAGVSLEEYMREHIWAPLGMRDTTFWPDEQDQSYASRRCAMSIREDGDGDGDGRFVQARKRINISAHLSQCAGGQGAFASMRDYAALVSALLLPPSSSSPPLLQPSTLDLMFQPQLSPESKRALLENFKHPDWAVGWFPDTGEYDWGLGGIVIDGDRHDWRRRGTMMWSGNANLSWFVDRASGVCGVFGCNLLPPADPQVEKLIKAFEEEVYNLGASKTKL